MAKTLLQGAPYTSGIKTAKVTAGIGAVDVVLGATGVYGIFSVPAGALVLGVRAFIDTAFTATVTLDIGDDADPDGWLATAKVAPTVAGAGGIHKYSALPTAEALAGGKLYAAANDIDITIGGTTVLAGKITVYVDYVDSVAVL